MTQKASPTMAEFADMQTRDGNAWWRLASGDHQNLYDEAVDTLTEIAVILRDPDWAPGMLEDIAELVERAGIACEGDGTPTWDRH